MTSTDAPAVEIGHLDYAFGVGEAMDTAQRMELGWASARRLVEETGRLGLGPGFVAGAWTDHASIAGPDDLVAAVVHQAGIIQRAGGIPIILSMPWLSQHGCDEPTYRAVYGAIIAAYPVAVITCFGAPASPRIYGRVFTAWGLAGVVGPWVAGWLYDTSGDYQRALTIAVVSSVIAAAVGLKVAHR